MDYSVIDRTIYEPNSIHKSHWTQCASPLTPNKALKLHGHLLTHDEIKIVRDYDEIYYMGKLVKRPNLTYEEFIGKSKIKLFINDHLGFRFEIVRPIHDSSYSTVVLTYDHKTRKYNHTKIVPNFVPLYSFHRNAAKEVAILKLLTENDPYNWFNCIPLTSHFMCRNVYCMSFPPWEKSLRTILKERNYRGFDCERVRQYAIQILHALMYMHDSKIIHCDIKPGKIVTEVGNENNIKIVGFHDSRFFEDFEQDDLQSLNYRSPEILLKMRATKKIDMWSFGCTLYELATGERLFKGTNEYTQLATILEVKGIPPLSLTLSNLYSERFFDSYGIPSLPSKFDISKETINPTQINSSSTTATALYPPSNIFENLLHDEGFGRLFLNLIDSCTHYLSTERAEAVEALLSPWINYNLEGSNISGYIAQNHGQNIVSYEYEGYIQDHTNDVANISIISSRTCLAAIPQPQTPSTSTKESKEPQIIQSTPTKEEPCLCGKENIDPGTPKNCDNKTPPGETNNIQSPKLIYRYRRNL